MALIHSPSLSGLFLGATVFPRGNVSVTIMAGVQPTPAALIADWATTYKYPLNCLASFNGNFSYTQPGVMINITNPQTLTAFGTGTATWAIIWDNNNWESSGSLSGGLPSARFMIVPATEATGNGVVRLSTTSLVSGQQFSVVDCSFTAQMV